MRVPSPDLSQDILDKFERDGIVCLPDALSDDSVKRLQHLLNAEAEKVGGVRHVQKRSPQIGDVQKSPKVQPWLDNLFETEYSCVRSIYFHKTADTNWFVPWHQDVTIAVAEKTDHPEFTNWTMKDAVPHTEAPVALLEKMVSVRIHLDDVGEQNGSLEILRGSHKMGRVRSKTIEALSQELETVSCTGPSGSVFLMKPLVLHRSSRIRDGAGRRTLQLECAPVDDLPAPLNWYEVGP